MIDVSYYIAKLECLKTYMDYWMNVREAHRKFVQFILDNYMMFDRPLEPVITFDEYWEKHKHLYLS